MKRYLWILIFTGLLLTITGCSFEFGATPNDEPIKESESEKPGVVEEKEDGVDQIDKDQTLEPGEIDVQMNIFESESLGFAVGYPSDWIYEKEGDNVVIFSGPEGTDSYYTTVNMQNILWGEAYEDFNDFYEDYKMQFEQANGAITEMTQVDYEQNGNKYDSVGFTSSYELNGTTFGQWVIGIDRGDGVFHQFSYTAPEDLFEEYQEIAVVMLDYFEIIH